MSNLLSADFKRLWKSQIMWICAISMLVISTIYMFNEGRQAAQLTQEGASNFLDNFYFNLIPYIGLLYAAFVSIFLGIELSDGTIRNKIVVGHTRSTIFLSNFIVSLVANWILLLTLFLGGLIGIPFLGFFKMSNMELVLYFVIALFFTAALTAILTLFCMLSTNKAITAVSAIAFIMGLLLISSLIYNSLGEPEYLSGPVITIQGKQQEDLTPNPSYVSGITRTVYQYILDFLPTGQGILIAVAKINRPIVSLLSSVTITIVTTIIGIFAFNKTDLK